MELILQKANESDYQISNQTITFPTFVKGIPLGKISNFAGGSSINYAKSITVTLNRHKPKTYLEMKIEEFDY